MKCFVLLVIVPVSAVFAATPPPPTGCTYEDLQKCNEQPSPDIALSCELFKKDDECFNAFNDRCIKKPKANKIADEIHASVVQHYNEVCGTGQVQQDYLKRIQACFTKPDVFFPVLKIQQRYVGLVEKAATYDKNDALPSLCCAILYVRDSALTLNTNECGQEITDYVDNALKTFFQAPFDEVCGDVASYDQCASTKLNAAHKADFKKIIDADPPLPTKNDDALPTLFYLFSKYLNN